MVDRRTSSPCWNSGNTLQGEESSRCSHRYWSYSQYHRGTLQTPSSYEASTEYCSTCSREGITLLASHTSSLTPFRFQSRGTHQDSRHWRGRGRVSLGELAREP